MENNQKEHRSQNVHHHVQTTSRNWYDRSHKFLLFITFLMILFSIIYLYDFAQKNGDIIYKDVSLTGGTTVTIFDGKVNIEDLKNTLKIEFPDISVRGISNIQTGAQQGLSVETKATSDQIKIALEKYLGYKLTNQNSSIEFSGSSLSAGFYQQLRSAVLAAFLLMGWVVFLIFADSRKIKGISTMLSFLSFGILLSGISMIRAIAVIGMLVGLVYSLLHKNKNNRDYLIILGTFVLSMALFFIYPSIILVALSAIVLFILYIYYSIPSFAVILSAFADIAMTIVIVDMLGIPVSVAGIVAFLMLIGYSVDTDILLTTRVLKSSEGTIDNRIFGAFKTGMTMTLAALASVGISLIIIYNFSDTLRQIFEIILIGLGFDIFNTWISNASILKWFVEVKGKR